MITLNSIRLKHPINMGAPAPKIVCDDTNLILLFYVDVFNLPKTTDNITERNSFNDSGIAVLKFKNTHIHKFGTPNDDVIIGHPYYDLGLKPYSIFSFDDSDWIKEIKRIQAKHPYFNEQNFDDLMHYIITFKDNTFECIAKGYDIEYSFDTMKECFEKSISNLSI